MIKKTVYESEFIDDLLSDEYAGWSYAGAHALYEYLENLSDDIGEDIELDRVALRCDYSEYESALEAAKQYGFTLERYGASIVDDETIESDAQEWLEERTTVIPFTGQRTFTNAHNGLQGEQYSGVIIQQF